MLYFFNWKFLCRCNSVDERDKVLKCLQKLKIQNRCIKKGANSRIRYNNVFWFNIYVHKADIKTAQDYLNILVNNLD